MNQHQRHLWQWRVRDSASLILARAPNPMSLDELHTILVRRFRRLKKCALSYMLNRNVDGWFLKVSTRWTYFPTHLWPCDCEDVRNRKNIRLRARRAWFKNHKLRDGELEMAKRLHMDARRSADIHKRLEIFSRSQHVFKLISDSADIGKSFKKYAIAAITEN